MAEAGVHRQAIHADGGVAHTLHDGTGEAHILTAGHHVGVIHVVAVVRRIAVVLHDEAGFALFEQKLDALVFVLGLAKATQLEYPPGFAPIAGGMETSVEGRLTRRKLDALAMGRGNIVCGVKRLQFYAGRRVDRAFGFLLAHGRSPMNILVLYISYWQ